MPRYLIEIPHEASHASCERMRAAIEFLGSHFMTHADWGCEEGVHSGWLITELENRDEARRLVPPPLRPSARVVELKRLDVESLATLKPSHQAQDAVEAPSEAQPATCEPLVPPAVRRAFASSRLSWA